MTLFPIEKLEIEDLQGVSGLKALRVPINYGGNTEEFLSMKEMSAFVKKEGLGNI